MVSSNRNQITQQLGVGLLDTGYDDWYYLIMSVAKVTVSIDERLIEKVDQLVSARVFSNRSQAIQEAVHDKLDRIDRGRLARECAKLDKDFERKLADEGLSAEADEWPEF
jgi:Arc/MetJ-type ribon-helix-helix transcriptional regulator